ncbi:thioester reductase domain-containing protein [Williamsia herbipolensis]|uniref:Carboxylic acid reductase n=1 Tax=Williamsia herbipolensis TaxID=1603258 RepID=A0AAU4K3W1_9NOCA|nr:carboxylic acid reductase [Williamsia herbipolensis]
MSTPTQDDTADTPSRDELDAHVAERLRRLTENDPQVAAALPNPDLSGSHDTDTPLAVVISTVLQAYADRPALGTRATETTTDASTGRTTRTLVPRFDTVTYGELGDRIAAVAAGWAEFVRPGQFVATLGFTSVDYAVIDLACAHLGAVSVPLQTSATPAALAPIIAETEPTVFAVSIDHLADAVELITTGFAPSRLVVFDNFTDDDDHRDLIAQARERLSGTDTAFETLADIVDRGRTAPAVPAFGTPESGAQDTWADALATLIYTSGSTGTPKGAMYPTRNVARLWTTFWFDTGEIPEISVNYMPMSHVAGRAVLAKTLGSGGTAYFVAASDLSTLLEDLALVRPTALMLVPRVCDMIFQRFRSEVDHRLDADATDVGAVEDTVKVELREELLGGRVLSAMCGTAPLAPEMAEFITTCADVPLVDGYGSTEAGPVLINGVVNQPPVTEYKLIDVPELGYHTSDTPYPRGELVLKSDSMFPGYYKRDAVTAEVFDDDGFYLTGDIMAETEPGHLVYLDRRKNVLKLSQGEFVAVSRLESIFVTADGVAQIFVYGNSSRAFLLAVVVPTDEVSAEIDSDAALRTRLLDAIGESARGAGLNSYEIPRDIIVERSPFTREAGLLSGVGKLLRPALTEHYRDRLEALYTQLADGQNDELRDLRRHGGDRPVLETVTRAAMATVGGSGQVEGSVRFSDLGGDSLSALTFSNLLTDIFDVEIPVGVLMSAATDLSAIAEHIERARAGAVRPTFTSVHGKGATEVFAEQLTLDKFIDAETLSAAPSLPRAPEKPGTVLLTGANGYLGRFLCLEWLERLDASDGRLVCIIRGRDAEDARARLESAFDSGDPELLARFRELAGRRLEVLAGDIADTDLGLDASTWQRLADEVDLIVHPAALVNHVLPYDQLFGPNVVGTAELIALALTSRVKPITYLSTVGVAADGGPSILDEDLDIRSASARRAVDETYANGYGNSKWAGEVLLREAHDLCELPVAVFRSDMILAHSTFGGQLNVPDMFTRLVLSVMASGVAPGSFYRSDDGSTDRPRAHYDGLPADFTATAITDLGSSVHKGYETYNVVNPHDDGISLDTVVDWLIDSGVAVTRIDDYTSWIARFETSIRALPEAQRRASLLPLLHAFAEPDVAIAGSAIPSRRFAAAVAEARIGDNGEIPHLSAELIAKYVADLRSLGLVDAAR